MAMTNGVAKQRPKLHPRMFTRANLAMYVAVGMVFWQQEAHASSLGSGGGGLPWDSALTTLANDLSGPVALAISVIAFAITGFMMVWGGEMTDFAKNMIRVIFAISVVTGGTGLFTKFFGSSGAVI